MTRCTIHFPMRAFLVHCYNLSMAFCAVCLPLQIRMDARFLVWFMTIYTINAFLHMYVRDILQNLFPLIGSLGEFGPDKSITSPAFKRPCMTTERLAATIAGDRPGLFYKCMLSLVRIFSVGFLR